MQLIPEQISHNNVRHNFTNGVGRTVTVDTLAAPNAFVVAKDQITLAFVIISGIRGTEPPTLVAAYAAPLVKHPGRIEGFNEHLA